MKLEENRLIRTDGVVLLLRPQVFRAPTDADLLDKRSQILAAVRQLSGQGPVYGLCRRTPGGESNFYIDSTEGIVLAQAWAAHYTDKNHLFVVALPQSSYYVLRVIAGEVASTNVVTAEDLRSYIAFELEREVLYRLHYSPEAVEQLGEPGAPDGVLSPERIEGGSEKLAADCLDALELTNEWQLEKVEPLLARLKPKVDRRILLAVAVIIIMVVGYFGYSSWQQHELQVAREQAAAARKHKAVDPLAAYRALWATTPSAAAVLTTYQQDEAQLLNGLYYWYPDTLDEEPQSGKHLIGMKTFGGDNAELLQWEGAHPQYRLVVAPEGMSFAVEVPESNKTVPPLHPLLATTLALMDRLSNAGLLNAHITEAPQTFGAYSSVTVAIQLNHDDMRSLGVIARQIAGWPVELQKLNVTTGEQTMSGEVDLTVYGLSQ